MMMRPKTAILDGDIIAYRIAFWAETEGIDEIPYRLLTDFKRWTPDGIDKVIIALSCPRSENYRRDFWPKYKQHRDSTVAPDALPYTIESIYEVGEENNMSVRCVDRLEADDLIGMMVSSGKAIGVTIDKDLRQVPGWHLNPDKEDDAILISKEDGDKFFYEQWMTGDSTDNIFGLWKIGPAKAKKLLDSTDKEDWDQVIMKQFNDEDWDKRPDLKKPDMSKEEFALAQARCVRILRAGDYNKKTKAIKLWSPIT
mgnify:CR=1 FL=1